MGHHKGLLVKAESRLFEPERVWHWTVPVAHGLEEHDDVQLALAAIVLLPLSNFLTLTFDVLACHHRQVVVDQPIGLELRCLPHRLGLMAMPQCRV